MYGRVSNRGKVFSGLLTGDGALGGGHGSTHGRASGLDGHLGGQARGDDAGGHCDGCEGRCEGWCVVRFEDGLEGLGARAGREKE